MITIATGDLSHIKKELEKIKSQAHKHRLLGLHTKVVVLLTFNYIGLIEVKSGKSKILLYQYFKKYILSWNFCYVILKFY